MKINEFNLKLEEQIIDEGIVDIGKKIWSKVKSIKKQGIKKYALAFVKMNKNSPELIKAKKMLGIQTQQNEGILLESKGKFTVAFAIMMLFLAGYANASTKISKNTSNVTGFSSSTNQSIGYVTDFSDALINMDTEDFVDQYGNSIVFNVNHPGYEVQITKDNARGIFQTITKDPSSYALFTQNELNNTGPASQKAVSGAINIMQNK